MPSAGKSSRLSEAFIYKYHEFYQLAIELLGQQKADDFIREVSGNGRFVSGKIYKMGFKHLLKSTESLSRALESLKDDGHSDRVVQAAMATCHIANQFKQLSEIWKELIRYKHTYSKTGELAQVALGDDFPWPSSARKLESGN